MAPHLKLFLAIIEKVMNGDRVKFFSRGDLSVGFYLDRLKTVADSIDPATYVVGSLNDALELFNITKFIDERLFHRDWSQEYTDELKAKSPRIKGLVARYFNTLTPEVVASEVKTLHREYYEDFIALFVQHDLGSKVAEVDFKSLFEESGLSVHDILQSKYLVDKYPAVIKEAFLSDPKHFEVFLGMYTYSRNEKKLHIPGNITKQEILELCNSYVESDDANPNYLDVLVRPIKGSEKYITLDPATKIKIKKRTDEIQERLFGDISKSGLRIGIAVLSSKEAYEKELQSSSPTDMIAYIDNSWLEKHHEYPDILNGFLYLWEFFSDDLISEMPSFPNKEMSALMRHMGVTTINSYESDTYFDLKHQLAIGKMQMIMELLSRHDVRLEDVIDWFFSAYSKDEFGVEWLPLHMPSKDEVTGNKTATLFRIEENIRTQYDTLATNGTIDREIVNMTNTPRLASLPSFTEKKYAYFDGDLSRTIANLLYSDQTSITHIDDSRSGHAFINLITSHELKLSDFLEHQKPAVQYLIDSGVIIINKDDTLGHADINELYVYKKLYADGVIGYHHSSKEVQAVLDNMHSKERVAFGNTLLCTQESDYLNFVLNNSQFDNSWAIRNMYQHGMPSYADTHVYEYHYRIALLVLIHHVIKINDELMLRKISQGEEPACAVLE